MPVGRTTTPSVAARAAAAYRAQEVEKSSINWLLFALVAALCAISLLSYGLAHWTNVLTWAAQEQRAFQKMMAGSLRAIRGGDGLAILTLCSATAAYGFVHALGPGHGKVLLGGAALASGVTMRRMTVLTVASSLAQAASAILLVLVGGVLLGWATRDLVGLTEAWLAPASAIAIASIGVLLILRGLRAWMTTRPNANANDLDACGCGHPHGPTASQLQGLNSVRDGLGIVGSIALRPCTGALFLLVIALRMDIFVVGCLAVGTMAMGTASLNLIVAFSGVTARRLAAFPLDGLAMRRFSATIHVAGGLLIAVVSASLAWSYMDSGIVFQ